ncbi:MAG TPA: DUF5615 family PIN-like protein [Candidatus Hodarchaeales archaeon]|nr:DUF5615 family PIN-like protein [Candidatus Hodarchaeales archaeon]
MKLLADENIPTRTLDLLKHQGMDIVSILDFRLGLSDDDVLTVAKEHERVLVTFDKDFGDIVFRTRAETKGVVLLRFTPKSPEQLARRLKALLDSEIQLEDHFVVLNDKRIRLTPLRR